MNCFDVNRLGLITSTVHSTRRHAQEIRSNLNLLRAACIEVTDPKFHSSLGNFAKKLESAKRVALLPSERGGVRVRFLYEDTESNDMSMIRTALRQKKMKLYLSCYFSTIRFTTVSYRKHAQPNDSCVLFFLAGEPVVGFITNIIETDLGQLLFRVHRVSVQDKLYISLQNERITCSNVFHGNLNDENGFLYVKPESIIEKIVHVYDYRRCYYVFYRIPNLCESS